MGPSVSINGLAATHPDPLGFWKLARRDTLTFGSLFLLAVVCLGQILAIGMIFWSRIHFGSHFDPQIYTDFQTIKSNQSVTTTLHLEEAQRARKLAHAPVHDQVLMLERAREELEQPCARQNENRSLRGRWKTSPTLDATFRGIMEKGRVRRSHPPLANSHRKRDGISPRHQNTRQPVPRNAEILSKPASSGKKFRGIAPPDSSDMKDALDHLQRLTQNRRLPIKRPKGQPFQRPPFSFRLSMSNKRICPCRIFYDLRFNLRFTLGSRDRTHR